MKETVVSLKEALPYVRHYRDKIFVIKVGGKVLDYEDALDSLASQIALLSDFGIRIVVVHGGGPQASALSRRLGVEPVMVAGRRVTDDQTLDIAKQIYGGKLNIELVSALTSHNIRAVGLTGIDGCMLMASKRPPVNITDDDGVEKMVDFGHVGDIQSVKTDLLISLMDAGFVPVVSSLAGDGNGAIFNINADSVAQAISIELKAKKLIFLTSTCGVLRDQHDDTSLVPFADADDMAELVENGSITSGMRPKVDACLNAATNGVNRTHIVNGLVSDTLLVEVFSGEGSGTMIVNKREKQVYKEKELG